MEKYIPVRWFLETNCGLKRKHSSYSEEFSVLNSEVPMVDAVPAEKVREILHALETLGGYNEIIEYIKFLLKEEPYDNT